MCFWIAFSPHLFSYPHSNYSFELKKLFACGHIIDDDVAFLEKEINGNITEKTNAISVGRCFASIRNGTQYTKRRFRQKVIGSMNMFYIYACYLYNVHGKHEKKENKLKFDKHWIDMVSLMCKVNESRL